MNPGIPFPLLSLPNEILQRVLELAENGDAGSIALFRLCSTKSKDVSNRLFFRAISLRSVSDPEKRPWRDLFRDSDYRKNMIKSYIHEMVEQLLDPGSDAALHVRDLCIGPLPEYWEENSRIAQLRTDLIVSKSAQILAACDGLRDFSWKLEASIPPSVLHVLHTKHPQCRLHISWEGKIHPVTNLDYITSPQLTSLDICLGAYGYCLGLHQIHGLIPKVNRLESLAIRYDRSDWGVNLIAADDVPLSCAEERDPSLFNLQHLELGVWFPDSPEAVRSCMRTVNWAMLRSLKLGCEYPGCLLDALRGQTPNLERLNIRLAFKSQREGAQGLPDDGLSRITRFVDFLSEAPFLNDLTLWVNNWDIWNLLWDKLPCWKGQQLRRLDLAWPSGYPHSHQRYWTAGDLEKLVAKAPNIEILALELEAEGLEDLDAGLLPRKITTDWPAHAREILLQLTVLRELRLAIPLYGRNTIFTNRGEKNLVHLREQVTERILQRLYDAFGQRKQPSHFELLEAVFYGRSWRMQTRNWRYSLERMSCSSPVQPNYRLQKSSSGRVDLDSADYDPFGGWDGGY